MARVLSRVGFGIREAGQALERLGFDLGWKYVRFERWREPLCRSKPLAPVNGHTPDVAPDAFVAPNANLMGDVRLGSGASVFYHCVVRGDAMPVSIGSGSNIQDGSTISTVVSGVNQMEKAVHIGDNVTIGHGATLRGCTIEDLSLVGMGACVLDGAVVERGAMVAAGAVVAPGTVVAAGQLWAGNPARFLRNLRPEEANFMHTSAAVYMDIAASHREDCAAASAGLS